MKSVTDVSGGMHYLLQNDDLVMLKVDNQGGVVTTSLVTANTADSKLSGTPQTTTISNSYPSGKFHPTDGAVASEAVGRMYNIKRDTIVALNAVDNGTQSPTNWQLTLLDPLAHFQDSFPIDSGFHPYGTVFTKVVMGDFNGDGLEDPLIFYASTEEKQPARWGLKAFTASDIKTEARPFEGPELFGNTELLPVASSIVVGDFNGDGRDEIAALLADYQTVEFYSVNPQTLVIAKTNTLKLPNFVMLSGQVALAAGRFRNLSGVTNADLVIFGQIDKYDGHQADYGYSVIPIRITANQDGTFSPRIVQQANASVSTPYFHFDDKHKSSGALAQAAPLIYWPQMVNEQLVLAIKTNDGKNYIEIGNFEEGKLDDFNWVSETERKAPDEEFFDSLQNMWVGNFDNLTSDGSHNPGRQIETYEVVFDPIHLAWQGHIHIFDVNVPSPYPPVPPPDKRGDWLKQKSDNSSGVPLVADSNSPPRTDIVVPGDVQGRSLRLGAPTIARIASQIQPDVVLAIPPMHVDWIAPKDMTLDQLNQPGCTNALTPCLVNISVYPDPPPSVSALGFNTIFKFDSSAQSSAQQTSTTSWGISAKESVSASASFNDGMENASESIKDTVKRAHDGTVGKAYNTYKGTSTGLSVTTGFTDHILYTEKDMNVYYYPVLGCDANCPIDTSKGPAYVVFSVPDNITYNNADSIGQDWYQPVHEYGNVLSYPWTEDQLQAGFTDALAPLTQPPTCMALGSGNTSATTTWNQGSGSSQSSGSTNSFSDELSISLSGGAGVSGLDGAEFNYSLDVARNTSLNTLNESTSSLNSSQGIAVTTPDFGYAAQCCGYSFGQYIFGLKNKTHPASENACTAGQTSGCIAVKDPTGKASEIGGTGPLFTGYVANPLQGSGQNCSGTDSSWWAQNYTKPDVALNHPERWNWRRTKQSVTFNPADRTYPQNSAAAVPIDQQFYIMKGFYISRKSTGGFDPLNLPSGPNLAVVNADNELSLTTRVYNYSLVDTTAPVHVRFYGQLYCSANGSSEKSCKNWKTNASCSGGDLCGDSFQIGGDQLIASIAGFDSPDGKGAPNWRLASVDFLPTQFPATKSGNVQMVFWVVVWMQDANGNPVLEMQDHGLTAVPGSNLTQITQVATEEHSNNVGMYPVHQFFQILPAGAPPQTEPGNSSLKSISLSTSSQVPLEQRTKIVAALQTTGAQMKSVNIAYYDGDPAKDGRLIDVQKIAYMDPDVNYYHRSFFTPTACGSHTLYAKAWIANSPAVQATTTTNVTLDSADFVQALINSTKSATITDATLRTTLLDLLNTASQSFQQGQVQAGQAALGSYVQQVAASTGSGISKDNANRLIGQSDAVLGCGPKGFSLSAAPSVATVSAGSNASYSIAVTPSGGFNGAVSLACTGAPQGANCDISVQSVTLDGVSQSTVTVTVTTSPQRRLAGIIGGLPPSGTGKLEWLLMLLIGVAAIAILHRARIRYPILGCVLLTMLLSIGGCGNNSTQKTPSGYYPLTIQATSENTAQIVRVSLHVQ